MKLTLMLLFYVLVLLCAAARTQAKEWRGITPLHSTRADVERLLGPPAGECNNNTCRYRTKEEVVIVYYSNGPLCDGSYQGGWMVPRDTAVEMTVTEVYDPEKGGVRFSDLKLDKSRYKETGGGHVPDISYFTDEEEGVSYQVQTVLVRVTKDGRSKFEERPGIVRGITYMPAAKDKHLKCPTPATEQPCASSPRTT